MWRERKYGEKVVNVYNEIPLCILLNQNNNNTKKTLTLI